MQKPHGFSSDSAAKVQKNSPPLKKWDTPHRPARRRAFPSAGAGRPWLLASGVDGREGRFDPAGPRPAGLRLQPPGRPAPLPPAGGRRKRSTPSRRSPRPRWRRWRRSCAACRPKKAQKEYIKQIYHEIKDEYTPRAETHDPHAGPRAAETHRPRNRIHRLRGVEGVPRRFRGGILAGASRKSSVRTSSRNTTGRARTG